MRPRSGRVLVVIGVVLGLGFALFAVTSSTSNDKPKAAPTFLVAVGDSYAEGYQPGFATDNPTLHGFNDQVVTLVAPRHQLILRNFGCGGATSESILHGIGCAAPALNAPSYTQTTQAAAATAFLAAHRGKIGLVTVSLGFNDISGCLWRTASLRCVAARMANLKTNLTSLVAKLRAVAGPKVPIIGTSYPDVWLASLVESPPNGDVARQSIAAFRQLINPTLAASYATGNASFVNVTEETGAFIRLTTMTTLEPFGNIPVAAAKVCTLTWVCTAGDIHPNAAGYTAIAKMVAKRYLELAK
ncbi:MAG: SGNH/GDSL hydrolase family protein [Actinomycetota bacterium]